MSPRSDRPRSLRELRPDLFVASRRHRARDAAKRARGALLRFFGRLVRQQGEDWRETCDDLRKQLAAAKREAEDSAREVRTLRRAVQVADAAARHADSERDDAQRISAKWEIEAADLRDRLTEALALLESERAAWREERAGLLRHWKGAAATAASYIEASHYKAALNRLRRAFGEQGLPYGDGETDPDPRTGRPGGADLLPVTPGTPEFEAGTLLYRHPDGTVSPVPPPPPVAPPVHIGKEGATYDRAPDMRPRPVAGQGSGPGGSANVFTASVPRGDDE